MSSFVKRILSAVVLLPLLILFTLLLPQYHMIGFVFFFTVAFILGSHEMYNIVRKKGDVSKLAMLAVVFPVLEYASKHFGLSDLTNFHFFMLLVILTFIIELFKGAKDDFSSSISRVSLTSLVLIYPGLTSTFVIDLAFLPDPTPYIFLYFAFVFSSDTFAFFTGLLFGKGNQGFIKVSPKKSVAGYIGGSLIPALIGSLSPVFFPAYYAFTPLVGFFLGLFTSFFAEIGDLVESLFKRSAGIKDSGTIIPGRGGILDSIDSLMIAAPAFMILSRIFGLV